LTIRPERLADLLARIVVGGMYTLLSINLITDYEHTHRVTGLLLLAGEVLVAVFTIFRRPAQSVDRSFATGAITVAALAGPPLFRTIETGGLVPDAVTALVSGAGLAVVLAGKFTLGRSFGIIPANRGVVASGPYLLVRHPIYAGYLITHVAFIAAHPTMRNLVLALVADSALVVRALLEERVLGQDERYRTYCSHVAWHLLPGVF